MSTPPPPPPKLQTASLLSDLTSLRACVTSPPPFSPSQLTNKPHQSHPAALALVNVNKTLDDPLPNTHTLGHNSSPQSDRATSKPSEAENNDPDLQRALDLVELHYGVKERYARGEDMGLGKAREMVARVVEGMGGKEGERLRGEWGRR